MTLLFLLWFLQSFVSYGLLCAKIDHEGKTKWALLQTRSQARIDTIFCILLALLPGSIFGVLVVTGYRFDFRLWVSENPARCVIAKYQEKEFKRCRYSVEFPRAWETCRPSYRELFHWCEENATGLYGATSYRSFVFEKQRDAVLFKLFFS